MGSKEKIDGVVAEKWMDSIVNERVMIVESVLGERLVNVFTGCAVAPACVNGDWLSQWERAIFDPLQNRHPLTDRQKNCHR